MERVLSNGTSVIFAAAANAAASATAAASASTAAATAAAAAAAVADAAAAALTAAIVAASAATDASASAAGATAVLLHIDHLQCPVCLELPLNIVNQVRACAARAARAHTHRIHAATPR